MSVLKSNNTAGAWSLRIRLTVLLTVATLGLWGIAAMAVYQEAEQGGQELFDESLRESAYLLLAVIEHEMAEHGPDYAAQLVDQSDYSGIDTHYLRFQVWSSDGRLIYRSRNASDQAFVSFDRSGYLWTNGDVGSLRTYAAWNKAHTLQIQVGEPAGHRRSVIDRTLWRFAIFAAVFLPVAGLLVWWIVARVFAPVQWVSEEVLARTPNNLKDVPLSNMPREISPLIVALNRLLERIREAIDYERRFTADAAHELRTPLAAIRAHAQVLRGARNRDEADEAAQDIIAGVDRGRRLIDQLLALASLDKAALQALPMEPVDLAALIETRVEQHRHAAEQLGVSLRAAAQPLTVLGHLDTLDVMLRNLIDNALRYTPAGGAVEVSSYETSEAICLAVRDSGCGIPAGERQRVFDRFYRIAGSASFGSGLGLSIVQRVIKEHGAEVVVESGLNGQGTGFVVRFSAAGSRRRDPTCERLSDIPVVT